jgi:adenylate cyclase class IV
MARNVEIKARVGDSAALFERCAALAGAGPLEIAQDDTFFVCPNGRLKLREFSPGRGELIFYQRPDSPGPKESTYRTYPTTEPALLRQALTLALGVCGHVRKLRRLFLAGNTRIHLDHVDALGDFVELEVVLADGEPIAFGQARAEELMTRLHILPENLLAGAYVDMLPPR